LVHGNLFQTFYNKLPSDNITKSKTNISDSFLINTSIEYSFLQRNCHIAFSRGEVASPEERETSGHGRI